MLSDRQGKLLEAIISEYLTTAEPVGSSLIVEKYNIKYSPATIRNEMAKLLQEGYLEMMHTSSGRVPTKAAYKFFLTEVMEEEELDVLQEVALKQRLWANRYEFEKLLRQAALALSELTGQLAIITTEDGHVIHAGTVNLLDEKEFWDIDIMKTTLHLLDRHELLQKMIDEVALSDSSDVSYLIGDELGHENLRNCSIVTSMYVVGKRRGHVSVFGPARMNYQKIIPAIRYTKSLIQELGGSW
jgi:transcriptional regulator of heat shock response